MNDESGDELARNEMTIELRGITGDHGKRGGLLLLALVDSLLHALGDAEGNHLSDAEDLIQGELLLLEVVRKLLTDLEMNCESYCLSACPLQEIKKK